MNLEFYTWVANTASIADKARIDKTRVIIRNPAFLQTTEQNQQKLLNELVAKGLNRNHLDILLHEKLCEAGSHTDSMLSSANSFESILFPNLGQAAPLNDDLLNLQSIMISNAKKKVPNTNIVKSSRTAHWYYSSEQKPLFRREEPNLTNSEIVKIVNANWKNLPDAEKAKYEALARQ